MYRKNIWLVDSGQRRDMTEILESLGGFMMNRKLNWENEYEYDCNENYSRPKWILSKVGKGLVIDNNKRTRKWWTWRQTETVRFEPNHPKDKNFMMNCGRADNGIREVAHCIHVQLRANRAERCDGKKRNLCEKYYILAINALHVIFNVGSFGVVWQ